MELHAASGTQKCAFETGDRVRSSLAISSDGSTVFVGSNDMNLYAFDAANGTQKWGFQTGSHVRSSPAISSDGTTVFVGSLDGKLYAVHAASGTQKWAFVTGYGVYSSPALSSDGTTVFVGSADKNLYAVHAANRTQKWAFVTGASVYYSSPAISSDGATVFVGSRDKNLYAIDAASGVMDSGDVLTTSDACVNETRTMKEIISGGREASGGFFQGGLGRMAQGDWKTYGCWRKHACLDSLNAAGIDTTGDAICYKFNSDQHSWLFLPPQPHPPLFPPESSQP